MAAMMSTALLEFPNRLWNLFKQHNSSSPNYKASQETIIKQDNYQKLSSTSDFAPERPGEGIIKAEPEPVFEDHIMPKKRVERYKDDGAFIKDDHSDDLSDVEAKKENLWDETQLEPYVHVTANDEGFEDWSSQELRFFNSLNDRGLTPMLWSYWKVDFPTLPASLFTVKKEEALIKNWKGLPATGAKALNALVQAGIYARERRKRQQDAAELLYKEINRYIKWSFKDAKWKKEVYYPLIVVNYAHRYEQMEIAEARGHSQVLKIAAKYKQLWNRRAVSLSNISQPTIFHVFLARTVMGFESYNCQAAEPEFRSIFLTDWKQLGHDIWNAMAIGILVEQCRLWMVDVDPKRTSYVERPETDQDL